MTFRNTYNLKRLAALCSVASFAFYYACNKVTEKDPIAGNATVADLSENAFGNSIPSLTYEQEDFFAVGNSFFRNNWVVAPASAQARDGLGPIYNALSCGSCHFKDGRGKPPVSGTDFLGLLLRLSVPGTGTHGEPVGDPTYGGQLNPFGIPGASGEASPYMAYNEIPGNYPDGAPYSLRKPIYTINNWNYGPADGGLLISPRIAPQLCGIGLLEAIPDVTILMQEDPSDANGDGISGKANQVWNFQTSSMALGRFGWKAGQPSLYQQTAKAFSEDLGVTSFLFTGDNATASQNAILGSFPNGGDPEIATSHLDKVVFYCQALAVPARRNPTDGTILKGEELFHSIGCGACHTEEVQTGNYSPIPIISNQTIHPYTDLLLHNMGAGLSDGRPEYAADGEEWRTPPLWGIGMLHVVNSHTFLLHDGRARNVEEAILWHGGEAENAKNAFMQLSSSDREALIQFIMDL